MLGSSRNWTLAKLTPNQPHVELTDADQGESQHIFVEHPHMPGIALEKVNYTDRWLSD